MDIINIICNKSHLENSLIQLFIKKLNFYENEAKASISNSISNLIIKFRDDLWFSIEYPYVDKVYRSSYYSYYSSKHQDYNRFCVRVSIFNSEISSNDFFVPSKYDELKNDYLGYFVLRPTFPFLLGRNIISKNAYINNNFITCKSTYSSSANSLKFNVVGFPHSSQDTETISCAETSLWSIMEYYGNKYSEYSPVLPKQIVDVLKKISHKREIPSSGLNIDQLSYTLKNFGFGTMIYSANSFTDSFFELISCYIESGIPLITALENGETGHANVCIGHSVVQTDDYNTIIPKSVNGFKIYDNDSLRKEFIFCDDNCANYQEAYLDKPANHYPDINWHTYEITHFLVPLYPKIYLDAAKAKEIIIKFLDLFGTKEFNISSDIYLRTFLTSSSSYKHKISISQDFNIILKNIISKTALPKFIWIAEISTLELFKEKKATGFIILDATEAHYINITKPLVMAYINGFLLAFNESINSFQKITLPLSNFTIYENNLC